jgi:hypothetical protein
VTALRQPEANSSGPWGKVPLWITTAPISDRAVRLFAFYSGTNYTGEDKVSWSLAATDKQLHWGMDKTKRARQELVRIGAIAIEPRSNKAGRLPDVITLNFVQQEPRGHPCPLPKRAPVPRNYTDTDQELDSSRRRRRRKKHLPRIAVGVTATLQEGTSAPLLNLDMFPDDDEPEDDEA